VAAFLVHVAATMVQYHPFQNVYFNLFAGPDLEAIQDRYEVDYWGLSCRQGLEWLVQADPSPQIRVFGGYHPTLVNTLILPANVRQRIRFTDTMEASQFSLNNFREAWRPPVENEVAAVVVDGAKICTVQREH
jgi:hypothetical protein